MGLGDWIMATAQVKDLNLETGKRIVVVDRLRRPRWSEVFENNPRIATAHGKNTHPLLNTGGARPYIKGKTAQHWSWRHWDKKPGELYLTDEERAYGKGVFGKILIEPHTKDPRSNKAWLLNRWQELVDRFPSDTFVQIGPEGSRQLNHVTFVQTTFRQGLGVLAGVRLFVGTEGAMHHAAAALGIPAVVLWSEFIAPEFTGYETQVNIRHAGKACGARFVCPGCKASMQQITVDEVHEQLLRALQ